MSDWQPIETAPRDGTRVLGTVRASWRHSPRVEAIEYDGTSALGEGQWRCSQDNEPSDEFDLWQPLPNPPEVSDE